MIRTVTVATAAEAERFELGEVVATFGRCHDPWDFGCDLCVVACSQCDAWYPPGVACPGCPEDVP